MSLALGVGCALDLLVRVRMPHLPSHVRFCLLNALPPAALLSGIQKVGNGMGIALARGLNGLALAVKQCPLRHD